MRSSLSDVTWLYCAVDSKEFAFHYEHGVGGTGMAAEPCLKITICVVEATGDGALLDGPSRCLL